MNASEFRQIAENHGCFIEQYGETLDAFFPNNNGGDALVASMSETGCTAYAWFTLDNNIPYVFTHGNAKGFRSAERFKKAFNEFIVDAKKHKQAYRKKMIEKL